MRRTFSTRELAFMIGVPAAWGVLLLFHPVGGDTFYENIEGKLSALGARIKRVGKLIP